MRNVSDLIFCVVPDRTVCINIFLGVHKCYFSTNIDHNVFRFDLLLTGSTKKLSIKLYHVLIKKNEIQH
jgi:hypothetical protein